MIPTKNHRRLMVAAASLMLASFGAAACSSSGDSVATPRQSAPTVTTADADDDNDAKTPRVVSAAEGAAARGRQPQFAAETSAAADSRVASDSVECGVYEPSQEEIDAANADSEALASTFDRYGVTYQRTVSEDGFVFIEYDYADVVAESVASSFWAERYPVEPLPQETIDEIKAQNDIIAAELDKAGVDFSRTTGEDGVDVLDYDYEAPGAQAAVEAAWQIISPPQPPTADELAAITADNAKLTAAFDEAGIAYELVSDELGWAWVEWDYEDPALAEQVNAVFDELYGLPDIEPLPAVDCAAREGGEAVVVDPAVEPAVEEPAVEDPAVEPAVVDPAVVDPAVDTSVAPIDQGFTPEVIAQRDSEVAALAAGFADVGVTAEVMGESPWQVVIFDVANDASVAVVAGVLATRG
jgi:hypothetical protein